MITIICANGIIDTTGCCLYITGGELESGPGLPSGGKQHPYSLVLTPIGTKVELIVQQFSDKAHVDAVHAEIIGAVIRGDSSVDIRNIEEENPTPIR